MLQSAELTTDQGAASSLRRRFAFWAFIYALAVIYVSVVVGPLGFHYVPRDPSEAWRAFLATTYQVQGSDQQADWMANVLMLVPLGFLLTGAVWSRQGSVAHLLGASFALLLSLCFVLIVKYIQLFFPPRTVTLNYIFAQSLGSLVGVAFFWAAHRRLFAAVRSIFDGGPQSLRVLLAIYALALLGFMLVPFDFVLNAEDFRERVATLPGMLFQWPGFGRSIGVRLLLMLTGTVATAPVGMLMALWGRRRSMMSIALVGLALMCGVTLLSLFVLGSQPHLVSVVYRTIGISIGAGLIRKLEDQDLRQWRTLLSRFVLPSIPVYVIVVIYINGLLSLRWRSLHDSIAVLDYRSLIPLWHDYIVSKSQAAASTVAHIAMYAPVGVMVSLRRGERRREVWLAAAVAFAFSFAIEVGRWLRAESAPDFNEAVIAAFAAGFAVKLMPMLWSTFESIAVHEPPKSVTGRQIEAGQSHRNGRLTHDAVPDIHQPRAALRTSVGWGVAILCLGIAAAVLHGYPLSRWPLAVALVVYAGSLLRWPALWLVVIPAVLPALDLAPWTGWLFLAESDLFVLVTLGILAVITPPRREDLLLGGLSGGVLAFFILVHLVSMALGLASSVGPLEGSDNPYLRPDNAFRIAKGFFTALALLPFLRARLRTHGDAVTWFGVGMAGGLAAVAVATVVERAVFTGLFDFRTDYRVVATFSSMHLGGGHIGAYIALALPFLLVALQRRQTLSFFTILAIGAAAGYALIVSFARAAYGSTLISAMVVGTGWALAARRRFEGAFPSLVFPAILVMMIGSIIVTAALDTDFMSSRLGTVVPDLAIREGNWTEGLALRDHTIIATLFGMGLGTYPRVVLARRTRGSVPTNFIVRRDGNDHFLSMSVGSTLYLGQKLPIEPGQSYKLSLSLRAPHGQARLTALLCEKLLLYSMNCRGHEFQTTKPGEWERFTTTVSSSGLVQRSAFGFLRRPVELSFSDPVRGQTVEIGDVRMEDGPGHNIVANGDFARGMRRWYFTDDDHLAWRIKNQYLMMFFEGGILGLAAFILVTCAALSGAVRSIGRGDLMGAAVAGSLVAFSCSCLFDYLLEAPRLATIFYLVAFVGLVMSSAPLGGRAHADRQDKPEDQLG